MNVNPDHPPLDRWRADELLEPDRDLWGLPAIAKAAGVSIDTVRRWHLHTDAPISKPGGRYFSTRNALRGWLLAR
ncbi:MULTISPECIES: DNA-binding protein [Paracoccus]|uniref:DNA-binding protein n=1 Tax=Paracoccus TaxID=265 RepID=UPI000F423C85|nr:DNA-binding protein [Paracoccus pantotrophus]RNI20990.1 DNA-binding protein [Paracoccus pantotrophus]